MLRKAVILAAGRGTRMQRPSSAHALTAEQMQAAAAGIKALMPVGRPFIDYLLSSLADAGYEQACLVIGPHHVAIREHCELLSGRRIDISFAIQHAPRGTADAVAAAEVFTRQEDFLLVNSDNYYPQSALVGVHSFEGFAVAGFTPRGLAAGNIAEDRLRSFALIEVDAERRLTKLIEKPDDHVRISPSGGQLINMNCWRLGPTIFKACRSINLSPRGEYELTDAVLYAANTLGEKIAVLQVDEPVLDLSTQSDISDVTSRLAQVEVRL